MDSFEDIAFFVRLIRAGSLSALARERNITPAAVSIRLHKLEDQLGVRLLNRSTRKLSLTHEGEIYFSRGAQLLADIKDLNQSISRGRTHPKGLLRVNAPPALGRYRISPLVAEFTRLYPEVEVQLKLSDNPLDLIESGFDVAIRFGLPLDSRLIARRIAPCRRILCASPLYLQMAGEPHEPRELQQHECIVKLDDELAGTWIFSKGDKQENVKIRGTLSSNDGETMMNWALMGHGIMVLHDWHIKRFLRSGLLCHVLPTWDLPDHPIYAMYSERTNLPAKVAVFMDFMAQHLACVYEESISR